MTKAEEAVTYCINRVINDSDFRWHMIATQAMRLLIQAEAERLGLEEHGYEKTLMCRISEAAKHQPPAQLPELRKQLDALSVRYSSQRDDLAALEEMERQRSFERRARKEVDPLTYLEQTL